MNSSRVVAREFGGLNQRYLALFEQAQRHSAMGTDLEQPLIERDSQNGRTPVLRNDREMSLLRVPEQFAGTLSDIACAEDADGFHSASEIMPINRSINCRPSEPACEYAPALVICQPSPYRVFVPPAISPRVPAATESSERIGDVDGMTTHW